MCAPHCKCKKCQLRPVEVVFGGNCATRIMAKLKEEQRVEIRFCVRAGMSRSECFRRLSGVHGAQTLSKSQVNRWFARFSADLNAPLKDKPRSRGARLLNQGKLDEINRALQQDKRKTCRQLSQECGVSVGSAHNAVRKHLQLRKKSAHWIPHLLTDHQKQRRVQCARHALAFLRRRNAAGPVHVITGDESWFWTWMPDSKKSSCQWLPRGAAGAGRRPTKVRIEQSTLKCMLVAFFDCQGLVYHEWVPQGCGITGLVYRAILERLRDAVRRRCPRAWRGHNWALLHDNAPAHNSNPAVNFLNQHRIPIVPHPGYSPDLSPPDFWLFNKVKKMTRGHRYRSVQDMMTAVDHALTTKSGLMPWTITLSDSAGASRPRGTILKDTLDIRYISNKV